MLFPLSGDVVSIHLGFKKMRIFKNKITFWYLCFEWNLNGIFTSHRFFDLFGQIYTDYLRTYAVPLIGDRNLKGWLRVLTQQSRDCLSPSGRLYSGCSCRYFSIQGFNSGISHSIVSQRLSGSTV